MNITKGWFHTEITKKSKSLANEAVLKNQFTNGPSTRVLEKELSSLFQVPTVLYTNSGTSALSISLIASNIDKSTTVATSGIGWIATAQAAKLTGAEVLAFDVEEKLPKLDFKQLSEGKNDFEAIIPVNYNGRQLDIEKLKNLFPGKPIIEDSCKSLFSKNFDNNSFSGTNGDFGCFSLGMISMLPGIYGGLVISNNVEDYEKLSCLKWHGTSYKNNQEIYGKCSYNFKSSNIHASVALGMLEGYENRIKRIKEIYLMYEEGLDGLSNNKLLPVDINKGELPLLIDIISIDRNQTCEALNSVGIPTCNYHNSISEANYVKSWGNLNNSCRFGKTVFHPPCGPDQDLKTIENTIAILKQLG